jgi:hypothetical protein
LRAPVELRQPRSVSFAIDFLMQARQQSVRKFGPFVGRES